MVEQHKYNVQRFGVDVIQDSDNLIKLDAVIHEKVNQHLLRNGPPGYSRNRDYLKSLSFEEQRTYMINLMKEFGWMP